MAAEIGLKTLLCYDYNNKASDCVSLQGHVWQNERGQICNSANRAQRQSIELCVLVCFIYCST